MAGIKRSRDSAKVPRGPERPKKVVKKSKQDKPAFVQSVADRLMKYQTVYVLRFKNIQNAYLTKMRLGWDDERAFELIFGKHSLIRRGLQMAEERGSTNISRLAEHLCKDCSLFATNLAKKPLTEWLKTLSVEAYASPGEVAGETVEITQEALDAMPTSNQTQLSKLGVPADVQDGKIKLIRDNIACKTGDVLTSKQCKLLKLLGIKLSVFSVDIVGRWRASENAISLEEAMAAATPQTKKGKVLV